MKKFILSTLFVFLMAFAFAAADDLSGSPIASESGNPGDSVTFDIVYTNTGSTAMTVSSTSTSLTSGTDTISAPSIGSVSVPANGSATVSFTMTVPAKTADTYIGTVTGTDTSNSANTESLPYSLVINSEDSFSGSTTLSSWNFTFTSSDGDVGKILDNDDDTLVISFSGGSSTLVPGASMTLSVTANPDTDMDFGSYSGTIAVSATGSSTVSGSISLNADIAANICEEGKQGSDFDIEIRNPDDGDDFIPGDTIPMEIKVENKASDDLDVELEVTLYNMDTGDKEKVERVEGSIDED